MWRLAFDSLVKYRRRMLLAATLMVIVVLAPSRARAQENNFTGALVPHHPGQLLGRFAQDPRESAGPVAAGWQYSYLGLSKKERELLKHDVSRIGSRDVGKGLNFYGAQGESELGRGLARELEKNVKTVDDPALNRYIEQLCQRLVSHSDAQAPLKIKILENNEINAFALPGGYLYVNTGLILSADTEAELAGVLGHEIAHVAERHATRSITKTQIWKAASLPLMYVGGITGTLLQQANGIAAPLTFLKFTRDAEREADMLGLQYMYAAGYDPGALVSFFEKLNATNEKHRWIAKAFMTHPMTADRIQRIQQEIATALPARDEYVVTTSEFEQTKSRLAELLGFRDQQQESGPVLRRNSPSATATP